MNRGRYCDERRERCSTHGPTEYKQKRGCTCRKAKQTTMDVTCWKFAYRCFSDAMQPSLFIGLSYAMSRVSCRRRRSNIDIRYSCWHKQDPLAVVHSRVYLARTRLSCENWRCLMSPTGDNNNIWKSCLWQLLFVGEVEFDRQSSENTHTNTR